MNEKLKNFYEGKKILVTGGAGFIGSHLVDMLVELKAHVTVLDNFSTGNINNLKSAFPFVTIHYADITSPYAAYKATENKHLIFHLAAQVSIPFSMNNPTISHNINVTGTKNLLDGCIKSGVQHFVFSSSSAVYGNNTTICSEDSPLNPISPYAQNKVDGELLCKQYTQQYKLSTTILRYFNVYGERQNTSQYASVVTQFKYALLNQLPITIFGDGQQTRDFITVQEVAQANLTLGTNLTAQADIYNIASGTSITLLELLNRLENELQIKRLVTEFKPERTGDIKYSTAQCSKYKNLIKTFL